MQHFRVKLFATADSAPDLGAAIPVFHRWIQARAFEELLIDVADYRHVTAGPGVILVGHDAIRSLDQSGRGLGLMYNRRTVLEGTVEDRIRQAVEAARASCAKLESEPEFDGNLKFDRSRIEISVNDRMLAPNTDATWKTLEPHLRSVMAGYQFKRIGDPRELFTVAGQA